MPTRALELRAIPGVENPLPEPKATPLGGELGDRRQWQRPAAAASGRAASTATTTNVLRTLADLFEGAKPLGAADRLAAAPLQTSPELVPITIER